MGNKNKTFRISEVARFENTLEYTDFQDQKKPKGTWKSEIFKNQQPITLELACGKGEYTVELARQYKHRNFIGIDIKGPRIWRGAKTALKEELDNVRFLRIFIDHLDEYFEKNEIDEIWITFPDPYIRKRSKRSKRLTSSKFLDIYRKVLKPGGTIHLKTDSAILYHFTQETIRKEGCNLLENIDDVYLNATDHHLLNIQT
ncbi:MAG: tRNA (guanosine(46)-N7)-methyltransferase TrmB, partial [Balneolaceae bacterium]